MYHQVRTNVSTYYPAELLLLLLLVSPVPMNRVLMQIQEIHSRGKREGKIILFPTLPTSRTGRQEAAGGTVTQECGG